MERSSRLRISRLSSITKMISPVTAFFPLIQLQGRRGPETRPQEGSGLQEQELIGRQHFGINVVPEGLAQEDIARGKNQGAPIMQVMDAKRIVVLEDQQPLRTALSAG